jgi:hypothetical protein
LCKRMHLINTHFLPHCCSARGCGHG